MVETFALVGGSLALALGGLYAATRVPFATWRFEHGGRRFEIR